MAAHEGTLVAKHRACKERLVAACRQAAALRLKGFQRREGDGAEETGRGEGPGAGVEGAVVDVHDVRVAHDFPGKFILVHVADTVGGEVGDVEFEDVAAGFEEGGSDTHAEGEAPRGGDGLTVEDDAGALADVAEIEEPVAGFGGGRVPGHGLESPCHDGVEIEFEAVARGAAEAFGFVAAEISP